jgi:hypothetical protein
VAIEDALAALSANWDDVVSRLGPEASAELYAEVDRLGGPGHDEAVTRLAGLLAERLPPDHPVFQALTGGYLFRSATVDWPALTDQLRLRVVRMVRAELDPIVGAAAGDRPARERPGQALLRRVAERLLLAPALTAEQVRNRGADPGDPLLIGLHRAGTGRQWPEFQFAPDGGALPVIRAVNEVLQPAADPLGAAEWWLSPNVWLGGQPSELIGQVADADLVQAARAAVLEA